MKKLPLSLIVFSLIVFSLALLSGAGGYFLYHARLDTSADLNSQALINTADMIGVTRPDFSLHNVDGELRHIKEWDGKVIALNFWATWCPPCLQEIPEFVHLQEKYADQGLQFIGIALEEAAPVKQFMQKHPMNYPVLSGELAVINIARAYGNAIGALPYTVIVDRSGQIAFVQPGPLSGEAAEAVIKGLL